MRAVVPLRFFLKPTVITITVPTQNITKKKRFLNLKSKYYSYRVNFEWKRAVSNASEGFGFRNVSQIILHDEFFITPLCDILVLNVFKYPYKITVLQTGDILPRFYDISQNKLCKIIV